MSNSSPFEQLLQLQKDLKKNLKEADDNLMVTGFAYQMKPNSENKKADKEAKQYYKDLSSAFDDVNSQIDNFENYQESYEQTNPKRQKKSKKLAKRFEKLLGKGKLDKAENLLTKINMKQGVDIAPYLSDSFPQVAENTGINLTYDFDSPSTFGNLLASSPNITPFDESTAPSIKDASDLKSIPVKYDEDMDLFAPMIPKAFEGSQQEPQFIAQADLSNPQKNYFDALTNPVKFIDDVKGLVDTLNKQTEYKQQTIDELLNRNKGDQSFGDYSTLLASSPVSAPNYSNPMQGIHLSWNFG